MADQHPFNAKSDDIKFRLCHYWLAMPEIEFWESIREILQVDAVYLRTGEKLHNMTPGGLEERIHE